MLTSSDKETLIAIEEWSIDPENICAIFRISSFVSVKKKTHVHFSKNNRTSLARTVTNMFSSKTVKYFSLSLTINQSTKIYLCSLSKWQGK